MEYSPEPVVVGSQHGNGWDICYCSRYGNSVVGGRVIRRGHVVYLNGHVVIDIEDYMILVQRWNEASGFMYNSDGPMNYYMCRCSIKLSNFPTPDFNLGIDVIFKVSLAILRVQPGSLITSEESLVCVSCLSGSTSACIGVKVESIPHNITNSKFGECVNYQISEYIYFLRNCESLFFERYDSRIEFVRELLSDVCHNSVDPNIRSLCREYDKFSLGYVTRYTSS